MILFIKNHIIWFPTVQLCNWFGFRISLSLSREGAIFWDEIENCFSCSRLARRDRDYHMTILVFRDENEIPFCYSRVSRRDRDFRKSFLVVEREKMKLTLVENSRDREFSLTSGSDARTLPTTTRVIIIVITMATVITIVIASQTLTSPPLPHPVPFGGQFGISQPLYPALAHFITRSCQIQSSSLCFDYHRNVAHCHHCHHCHQYYTIVVTDSPHSSSCSFTIVQLYFETATFISGCQSQMTGRHFQSRCERSHPTLSFASDPTIPSNIEKNPSTISQCSRDCLCFAARFVWKKVNTRFIPGAFQTLRFFCSGQDIRMIMILNTMLSYLLRRAQQYLRR